ncbi:MAG TPA: extracellular solute-binding protein [Chloroflexota bacterium]|nr:extracellular solute-binding protein [Chloroflexota bacterium]
MFTKDSRPSVWSRLSLAAGLASGLIVSSCQGQAQGTAAGAPAGWDQVVAAASKEGQIVVAGPPGNLYRQALLAFQQAYPRVQVQYTGFSGRDLGPRVLSEEKAGQFLWDVQVGGANTILSELIPGKATSPLPRDLPETRAGANDDKWRGGFDDGFADNGRTYAYAFSAYLNYAIYVNRDGVSETQLSKGEDLLKSEIKGKIAWNEPRETGAGSLDAQRFVMSFGEDFLRNVLSTQAVTVTRDLRQQAEWLVRGTYPVAIGVDATTLSEFEQNGVKANIKTVDDPNALVFTSGFGNVNVMTKPPHPNSAKVFVNWLLSEEGQTAWAKISGKNSRRLDVPIADQTSYAPPDLNVPFLNKEEFESARQQAAAIARDALQ